MADSGVRWPTRMPVPSPADMRAGRRPPTVRPHRAGADPPPALPEQSGQGVLGGVRVLDEGLGRQGPVVHGENGVGGVEVVEGAALVVRRQRRHQQCLDHRADRGCPRRPVPGRRPAPRTSPPDARARPASAGPPDRPPPRRARITPPNSPTRGAGCPRPRSTCRRRRRGRTSRGRAAQAHWSCRDHARGYGRTVHGHRASVSAEPTPDAANACHSLGDIP